jgi:hypothetical protein
MPKQANAKVSPGGAKPRRRRRPVEAVPPPKPSPPYHMIRITPDLIERVDAQLPAYIKREPFIRHLLDLQLTEMEEEE